MNKVGRMAKDLYVETIHLPGRTRAVRHMKMLWLETVLKWYITHMKSFF